VPRGCPPPPPHHPPFLPPPSFCPRTCTFVRVAHAANTSGAEGHGKIEPQGPPFLRPCAPARCEEVRCGRFVRGSLGVGGGVKAVGGRVKGGEAGFREGLVLYHDFYMTPSPAGRRQRNEEQLAARAPMKESRAACSRRGAMQRSRLPLLPRYRRPRNRCHQRH
jgi:hypothetical protein